MVVSARPGRLSGGLRYCVSAATWTLSCGGRDSLGCSHRSLWVDCTEFSGAGNLGQPTSLVASPSGLCVRTTKQIMDKLWKQSYRPLSSYYFLLQLSGTYTGVLKTLWDLNNHLVVVVAVVAQPNRSRLPNNRRFRVRTDKSTLTLDKKILKSQTTFLRNKLAHRGFGWTLGRQRTDG